MELIIPFSLAVFSSAIFLSKNPVYGVLSFVVVVTHVAILLIGLNLEFLAYTLIIVYVGAIVVLFLFVIMMFYIREAKTTRSFARGLIEYSLLGLLVGSLLNFYSFSYLSPYTDFALLVTEKEFSKLLSQLLFNDLALLTISVTFIMLIGIIGAIILTVRVSDPNSVTPSKIRIRIQDTIEHKI